MKWPASDVTELLNPNLYSTHKNLIISNQILLFSSYPSSFLTCFPSQFNQYTCILLKNHNLTLYLYYLDCQVGSIQITMTNNHYRSRLEPILEIIKLHMPKQQNPSIANPAQWTLVLKYFFVFTNRGLVNTVNLHKSFGNRMNLVNTNSDHNFFWCPSHLSKY